MPRTSKKIESNYDEKNIIILLFEIIIISVVAGFYYQSWWIFGGLLLGLIIALNIKTLAIIINVIFSLGWAFVGYTLGALSGNVYASIILAIIGLIAGYIFHKSGIKWKRIS